MHKRKGSGSDASKTENGIQVVRFMLSKDGNDDGGGRAKLGGLTPVPGARRVNKLLVAG
jgi:hypothetical protein